MYVQYNAFKFKKDVFDGSFQTKEFNKLLNEVCFLYSVLFNVLFCVVSQTDDVTNTVLVDSSDFKCGISRNKNQNKLLASM